MVTPGPSPDAGSVPPGTDMETLWAIAEGEYEKRNGIEQLSRMWLKTGTALESAGQSLRFKASNVRAGWHDDTYQDALGKHLDKGVEEVERAMTPAAQAGTALANVIPQLETTYAEVRRLKEEYDLLQSTQDLLSAQNGSDLGPRIEQVRQSAEVQLGFLAQRYGEATKVLEQAMNESEWTGPTSANGALPPTSPDDPTAPGPSPQPSSEQPNEQAQQPGGEQPGGQQPGGEQPGGQQPGGEQPGGQQPGGQPPGGATGPGDTGTGGPEIPGNPGGYPDLPEGPGLSGGPTGAPPTLPKLPDTPPTSPGTSFPPGGLGGGGGIGGLGGGVGSGASTGSGTSGIDQAARNLSTPTAASPGQAPGLAGRGMATPSAASTAGGMPPMMPPMMPPGAGAGGGNGQPKPGTAQAAGKGRNRPAGPTPGVPSGLRGRVGKGDGGTQAKAASRRARRDGPQTVELLDSELWDVEQPNPAATPDQSSTRKAGTPRPAN